MPYFIVLKPWRCDSIPVWAHNAMARGRGVDLEIPRVSPWAIVGIAPSGAQAFLCARPSLTAYKKCHPWHQPSGASTSPEPPVTDDSKKSHPWHRPRESRAQTLAKTCVVQRGFHPGLPNSPLGGPGQPAPKVFTAFG